MTEYKQLCAELVELSSSPARSVSELAERMSQVMDLADRARAALAEPEPKEPTSRQLMMLADDMGMTSVGDAAEYARAVLARWGNHPGSPDSSKPQPVPVSERLPGPEDCDAEGRCWWLKERANPEHDLLMPTWHLQRQGPAGTRFFRFTHWLPANALPQPS